MEGFFVMGRPRIYESVEELDGVIYDYFFPEVITAEETQEGPIVKQLGREPRAKVSISGLTLALGFADKTTLYDYRDRDEFSHSIKGALLRIENYHEERLSENNVAGTIFALKNMGWKDKTETELSGGIGIKQITGMQIK